MAQAATELEEIAGTFVHQRYYRDDWVIGEVETLDGSEIVKGNAEADELKPGLDYRFYGSYVEHPRYGRSFAFRAFVPVEPHGRAGVIRYLQQAPHVGLATAEALWDHFGSDAVRVLREDPLEAVNTIGSRYFSFAKAEEASGKLQLMGGLEDCTIDLFDILDGRGFPKALPAQVIWRLGNRGATLIRKNPYLLLMMGFRGCGFLRCDRMYIDFGGDPGRLKRQALCIWHAMASDTNGHTWYSATHAIQSLREKIAGASIRCGEAIELGVRAKVMAVRREGGDTWLANRQDAEAEADVASFLREALASPECNWPDACFTSGLTAHQNAQLDKAVQRKIGILGGSPGTGKTFTASTMLRALAQRYTGNQIAVAAPTGKAATRITSVMEKHRLSFQATTIHRLLEVRPAQGSWRFERNRKAPLTERFVVIDEASMIDTALMAHLLAARGPDTHILFVCDTHQLPPVGRGAPLRDMIAAGLPYGELTEIRRNAGQIVRACADVRNGREFAVNHTIDLEAGKNLKLLEAAVPIMAQHRLLNALEAAAGFCDPVWDCQVIVAVNQHSPCSRTVLNKLLQEKLNPNGSIAGTPFRKADKVICLKNSLLDGQEGTKTFVANGDIGRVLIAEPNRTVVEFLAPERTVVIPRGKPKDEADWTGCDLDLAYAVTCHKFQGSEVEFAFVVLDESPGANMVCTREWLYTAISRATTATLLVGRQVTAYKMLPRRAIDARKTFLKELIQHCTKGTCYATQTVGR